MFRKSILLFTMLLYTAAWPQKLRTSLDWASFEYDRQNAYVEFYYAFPASELNYLEAEGFRKGLTLGVIRLFADGALQREFPWKTENIASETSQQIIDRINLVVPFGSYDAEFVLKDLNQPSNFDSVRFALNLPTPTFGRARLSELELAGSISQSNEVQAPFYKNGLIVEPNPSLIYNFEKPALFFYLEAYDLPTDLTDGYRLSYSVHRESDDRPADLPGKSLIKKNVVNPSVEFGMLNVGKLATGNYRLIVELQTTDGEPIAARGKPFYVIQKAEAPIAKEGGTPFEESIFATMDSAQIDLEFQMIFYLLSKEEQLVHKQVPTLEGKRRFVYNFWHNKYPTEPVNDNQARVEYYRRFAYANENFRAFTIDGWKTDRGRVYMIYGPYDDIERRPNEQNYCPYEIWFYHKLQNGARFVFGDLEGYKNYRLVHSDLFGEIQDYNFMAVLRKGY